ncbi:MAG: hypothetical protein ACOYOZ_13130 [Pirellula sp.]|jgi:hypothetical protein
MPEDVATNTQEADFRQLVTDIKQLSEVPEQQIDQLSAALHSASEFYLIKNVIAEAIDDDKQANAVGRLVENIIPESLNYWTGMIKSWRKSLGEPDSYMTEVELEAVSVALKKLIRNSPAITRVKKAQVLKTVTGNEVFGVMFVCDARPVYNEARDDIEGYLPVTTMKIVYQRQNGDSEEIEFALTPSEIDLFIDRATKALEKVKVLNAKLNQLLPNAIVEERNE